MWQMCMCVYVYAFVCVCVCAVCGVYARVVCMSVRVLSVGECRPLLKCFRALRNLVGPFWNIAELFLNVVGQCVAVGLVCVRGCILCAHTAMHTHLYVCVAGRHTATQCNTHTVHSATHCNTHTHIPLQHAAQ